MRFPFFVFLLVLLRLSAPALRESVLDLVPAVSSSESDSRTENKPRDKGDKGSEIDPNG